MTRRIDVFLQYYKPHVSGLTNMAATLAEFAAAQGYDVHVHCVAKAGASTVSEVDGVTVHAYRRSFSLGRGNFSFGFLAAAWRVRSLPGIAHFHLPLPESAFFAWTLRHRPLVVTYQCDAPMIGRLGTLAAKALDISHGALIRRSAATATSSTDYANNSRLSKLFRSVGSLGIPATSLDRAGGSPRFAVAGRRQIGFLGRPTSEKGIDVLMEALDRLPDDVMLTLAGPLDGLSADVGYDRARLQQLIDAGRVRSLGFLEESDIADFYASLDLFVLPSTNSFEAFGIVQVEAISAGTPVVASDLPGVRTIPRNTGYGEIAPVGDAEGLAKAIEAALSADYDRSRSRAVLESVYLPPVPENAYLAIFDSLSSEAARP
ncbi:glycosyltransferase [Microbacterium timonense]|uniref:glycosyltransferase n=1 Tax=Microbacterium timonense TaxID=2086576 RepID=UPI000D0FD92F|nr:glycosyltransferase [Microbacterium timonense]